MKCSAGAEAIYFMVTEQPMAFYYLLLGHLIGDFVLQTDKIAENKGRYLRWNFLHALVVTLCILFFAYPFSLPYLCILLVNGIAHFLLDYYKTPVVKKLHLPELAGFLLDQFIHISLLYFISRFDAHSGRPAIDFVTVKYLTVLVIVTSFSAVFTQFILAAVFRRDGSRFFKKGEKNVGILARVYMAVVFYLSYVQSPGYLFLLLVIAAAFFLQFRLGWNKWMSASQLAVKLLLDLAISFACVFLL